MCSDYVAASFFLVGLLTLDIKYQFHNIDDNFTLTEICE